MAAERRSRSGVTTLNWPAATSVGAGTLKAAGCMGGTSTAGTAAIASGFTREITCPTASGMPSTCGTRSFEKS